MSDTSLLQNSSLETLMQQNSPAAMGEMIGSIAHQWRQPLNNVALIIQGIQLQYDSGRLTSEELHNDIHEVMEVLLQMSRTIDDFHDFSRRIKKI